MSETKKPDIDAFIKVTADPDQDSWFGFMWGTVQEHCDEYFRMDAGDAGVIDIRYTNTWEEA